MKKTKALWWSIIAVALLVTITVILPRLARARVGSWVTADVKLARCTNSPLKILIKQMPKRQRIELVLGVPEEVTNAMEHVSGLISTSGGLTAAGATNIAFAITVTNQATRPSIILSSEEPLIAYFLGRIEGAPSRFRPAEIDVTFSNALPAGVSLWARYGYDRYHAVHMK